MTGKASDELELVIWGGCHALGGGSSASLEAQVLDACRERRGRGEVVCGGRLESRFRPVWSYILWGWWVGKQLQRNAGKLRTNTFLFKVLVPRKKKRIHIWGTIDIFGRMGITCVD